MAAASSWRSATRLVARSSFSSWLAMVNILCLAL